MNFLQQYIGDLQHPIFITEEGSQEIQFANTYALSQANTDSLTGSLLDDHLKRYPTLLGGKSYGQYFINWYEIIERTIENGTKSYLITELKHREELPFKESFEDWKRMVAVMLHRLRSPLTGIIGYLEMMEDENTNQDLDRRFSSINKGFDHVFGIMDELETLYQLDYAFDDEEFEDTSLLKVIKETLDYFPEEIQKRFHLPDVKLDEPLQTDPKSLQSLLMQLFQNAVYHSDGEISISLDPGSPVTLKIENKTQGIDPEIAEKAFFPFVTSRADYLGIGLTTALLYAKRIGAALFFHSSEETVTIRIVFPFE